MIAVNFEWITLAANAAVTLVTVGVLYGRLSANLSGIISELKNVERLLTERHTSLEATMNERKEALDKVLDQNATAHGTIHRRLDDISTRLTRLETKAEG